MILGVQSGGVVVSSCIDIRFTVGVHFSQYDAVAKLQYFYPQFLTFDRLAGDNFHTSVAELSPVLHGVENVIARHAALFG